MKTKLKLQAVFLIFIILLFSSCRSELIDNLTVTLEPNSNVANLIENTSLNDGSKDNIIDNANCFTVNLPVTVIVNGTTVVVATEADYAVVEAIFDASDTDTDTLEIIFPITITWSNFNNQVVNNQSEFENFRSMCNGENEVDDDIECIDFNYPITATIFDTVTEQTNAITINSDNELHDFLENIDNDDIVTIDFPITVVLFDGTVQSINSLDELETVIDDAKDTCDEDDDFDFDDDDCIGCSQDQLTTILTGCADWTVDKLEVNDDELEDNFIGFKFNFFSNGTIDVLDDMGVTHPGTWSSSGTGLGIMVVIDIPTLPDFNATWDLHEINENGSTKKVDLRQSNSDRLRFESPCN